MINQNSYGPLQICPQCKNPLEKARVHSRSNTRCQKCQKEYANKRQKLVREGKIKVKKNEKIRSKMEHTS
jgi:DNA-directed RNA polymerase subunit M/transcription elongation factor TFIIS